MKEKSIQNHYVNNYSQMDDILRISCRLDTHPLSIDDLCFHPLKYLMIKKLHTTFQKIISFDTATIFPCEWRTAYNEQNNQSAGRIDCLAYHEGVFCITEIKYNGQPERQTLTELLQYMNGLQMYDFPGLTKDRIVCIVVVNERSNILVQSIINAILFHNINIIPINLSADNKEISYSIHNLRDLQIVREFSSMLYNENFYKMDIIAYDNKNNTLSCDYEDHKKLSMLICLALEKHGYNGAIFHTEKLYGGQFTNAVGALYFDLSMTPKLYSLFHGKKIEFLKQFHADNLDYIDLSIVLDTLKHYYIGYDIDFDLSTGRTLKHFFSELLVAGGFCVGFLRELSHDLIKLCHKDNDLSSYLYNGGHVSDFNQGLINNWGNIQALFELGKSTATTIEEYKKGYDHSMIQEE